MRKNINGLLLVTFLILTFSQVNAELQSEISELANAKQGEIMIQLFDESDIDVLEEKYRSSSLKPIKCLSRRMNIWLFEYNPSNLKADQQVTLLENIRSQNEVSLAQFNHAISMRATIPNDTYYGNQWGSNNTGQSGGVIDADIDAPEAWDIALGDTTVFGDQIVVAIIDAGFDLNHFDISYFKNENEIPGNGIDDDGNGYIDDYDGWNAYNSSGNITSDSHGTHVAGIAAAIGNNSNGIAGVNWGAKVIPIQGSSSYESTVIEAYGYALELRATYNETNGAEGAFVVSTNSSFGVDYGNPANYPLWCAFYDSLGEAGILSMAATANINLNVDVQGDVPTACASDYLISVTNTTRYDEKNSGAAYGTTTIDLGAPGTSIYSTLPGNSYGNLTGTSMATPQVCGAVGLLWSGACNRMMNDYYDNPGALALIMKENVLNGVDPLADLLTTTVSSGRLNVFNSMLLVLDYTCGVSIDHTPLTDTRDYQNDYEITAIITSEDFLKTDSLLLYYKTDIIWSSLLLNPSGNPDEFSSFIPAQSPGTFVDYYLFAVDVTGAIDSTDVFTFKVIDYDYTISPDYNESYGAVDDTVWHSFEIQNIGVYDDVYQLSVTDNFWTTTIWNNIQTSIISSTPSLLQDEVYTFYLMVEIPVSYANEFDTAITTIVSDGNSIATDVTIKTVSFGEPLQLPFYDDFALGSFDPALWTDTTTASIELGLNPPSTPYCMNFDGQPNGADTVISQIIDLENKSNVNLSYMYQRTGNGNSTETGDDLFIEYLSSTFDWITISTHFGSGADMTDFEYVELVLPSNAYHSTFKLRIRNIATPGTTGTFDDWFVDNISISSPYVCGDVNGDGGIPGISDLTYLVDYLFNGGPPPPVEAAADMNGSPDITIGDLTTLVDYLFNNEPSLNCM